jgi:hypothetical protein
MAAALESAEENTVRSQWRQAETRLKKLFKDDSRLLGHVVGKLLNLPLHKRVEYFHYDDVIVKGALTSLVDAPSESRDEVLAELSEIRQLLEKKEIKGFSSVGSTEAVGILTDLDLCEPDGNKLDPIIVPAGQPEAAPFEYSAYPNEDAGTPSLLQHHQEQLEKYGVYFGRGGFEMYNIHKKIPYLISTPNGQNHRGTADGCLAPYGLSVESAGKQCRVLYKHKYRVLQSEEVSARGD